jgi:hypothetical protein
LRTPLVDESSRKGDTGHPGELPWEGNDSATSRGMLGAMRYEPRSGPRYELRIGDEERDAAAAQLREHFTAGRLTFEEFLERLDSALTAKTQAQISRLMADLPRLHTPAPRPKPASEGQNTMARYGAVVMLAVLVLLWMMAVMLLFRHGYAYQGTNGYGP